jgi:hypothetical protein
MASPQRLRFSPRPAHMRLAMDKVAVGHVSLHVLWFSTTSIIAPMLHIHSPVVSAL